MGAGWRLPLKRATDEGLGVHSLTQAAIPHFVAVARFGEALTCEARLSGEFAVASASCRRRPWSSGRQAASGVAMVALPTIGPSGCGSQRQGETDPWSDA